MFTARGSALKPVFESVPIADEDGDLIASVVLERESVAGLLLQQVLCVCLSLCRVCFCISQREESSDSGSAASMHVGCEDSAYEILSAMQMRALKCRERLRSRGFATTLCAQGE